MQNEWERRNPWKKILYHTRKGSNAQTREECEEHSVYDVCGVHPFFFPFFLDLNGTWREAHFLLDSSLQRRGEGSGVRKKIPICDEGRPRNEKGVNKKVGRKTRCNVCGRVIRGTDASSLHTYKPTCFLFPFLNQESNHSLATSFSTAPSHRKQTTFIYTNQPKTTTTTTTMPSRPTPSNSW